MKDEDLIAALGDVQQLRELLAGRVLREPHEDDALSVLHEAASEGQTEALELLLNAGGDRYINSGFGPFAWTPLLLAARSNHIATVRLLLDRGADPNNVDEDRANNTVLRDIVGDASVEMIEILVEAGADPTIPGWMNINALDVAERRVTKQNDSDSARLLAILRHSRRPPE